MTINPNRPLIPRDLIDTVVSMRERGMLPKEIAAATGLTNRKVSNIYSRYGNVPPQQATPQKHLERMFDFTSDNLEVTV